eukprot:1158945-Amphidinium_carterae.1
MECSVSSEQPRRMGTHKTFIDTGTKQSKLQLTRLYCIERKIVFKTVQVLDDGADAHLHAMADGQKPGTHPDPTPTADAIPPEKRQAINDSGNQ